MSGLKPYIGGELALEAKYYSYMLTDLRSVDQWKVHTQVVF